MIREPAFICMLAAVTISTGPAAAQVMSGGRSFKHESVYSTGVGPAAMAIGDLNGDGRADLVVASADGPLVNRRPQPAKVWVLLGMGTGKFHAAVGYLAGSHPNDVAIGDVNRDGNGDLVVSAGDNYVSVLFGDGSGRFQQPAIQLAVSKASEAVDLGDLSGDRILDIAVVHDPVEHGDEGLAGSYRDNISVLLNRGNGAFAASTRASTGAGEDGPSDIAIDDVNGDGRGDLVLCNTLHGKGNGAFGEAKYLRHGSGPANSLALGFINGDRHRDLVVTHDKVSVLLNNGNGTFKAPLELDAGSRPGGVAIGDVNGDGNQDLVVTTENGIAVLQGDGRGSFAAKVEFKAGQWPSDVVIGDFNGDRRADLAVSNARSNDVYVLLGTGG
jgi:hypothetical protein